jgi:hypothetical protein
MSLICAFGLRVESASAVLTRLDELWSTLSSTQQSIASIDLEQLRKFVILYQSIGATGGNTVLATSNSPREPPAAEATSTTTSTTTTTTMPQIDAMDTISACQSQDNSRDRIQQLLQQLERVNDSPPPGALSSRLHAELLCTLTQHSTADAQELVGQCIVWIEQLAFASSTTAMTARLEAHNTLALLHVLHSTTLVYTSHRAAFEQVLHRFAACLNGQLHGSNTHDLLSNLGIALQHRSLMLRFIHTALRHSVHRKNHSDAAVTVRNLPPVLADLHALLQCVPEDTANAPTSTSQDSMDLLFDKCATQCESLALETLPSRDDMLMLGKLLQQTFQLARTTTSAETHSTLPHPMHLLERLVASLVHGIIQLSASQVEASNEALWQLVQLMLEQLLAEFGTKRTSGASGAESLPAGMLLDWVFQLLPLVDAQQQQSMILAQLAFGLPELSFAESVSSWILHDWPWESLRNCANTLLQTDVQALRVC